MPDPIVAMYGPQLAAPPKTDVGPEPIAPGPNEWVFDNTDEPDTRGLAPPAKPGLWGPGGEFDKTEPTLVYGPHPANR